MPPTSQGLGFRGECVVAARGHAAEHVTTYLGFTSGEGACRLWFKVWMLPPTTYLGTTCGEGALLAARGHAAYKPGFRV